MVESSSEECSNVKYGRKCCIDVETICKQGYPLLNGKSCKNVEYILTISWSHRNNALCHIPDQVILTWYDILSRFLVWVPYWSPY